MKTFPLRVLAPERTFFDGACTSLTVPSIDGMYGLMAQHEDIVLAIVPGKLTLRGQDGDEQIAAVSEGLLKMENGEAPERFSVGALHAFAQKTPPVSPGR